MRIKSITCSGFRGVKGLLQIDVPAGFLIVSGANGAGKSTLCDAVEFALTGSLREHQGEADRQEKIGDYFWWRGRGESADRFVSVTFIDTDGSETEIRRNSEGLDTPDSEEEITRTLCNPQTAPPKSVSRLLQTAVIRDEEITRLSVDLPETHRFQFVRAAVGEADLSSYIAPLDAACNELKNLSEAHDAQYSKHREEISSLTESIAEKQARIAAEGDVTEAQKLLNEYLSAHSQPDNLRNL